MGNTITTLVQKGLQGGLLQTAKGEILNHLLFVQRKFLFTGSCRPDTKITTNKNGPTGPVMRPEYGTVGINGLKLHDNGEGKKKEKKEEKNNI